MRTVLKCLSVGILLLFFSCKNEEALPLLNPESEMCEIRFSGSAFDFQWNGKALDRRVDDTPYSERHLKINLN